MKTKSEWAVLPYNSSRVDNKYLISNFFGSWSILNQEDFVALEQLRVSQDSPLFKRLSQDGMIVQGETLPGLINQFRSLNDHLFIDTALHIAVVTTRCNFSCRYCQTKTKQGQDMNFDVALRVLKYLFDVRNPKVNLEFQGGEPLLNWKVIKFLAENARKINVTGKDLRISLVTNGILLDDKKIDFLIDNDVSICISLDGPEEVHDKNRIFNNSLGTYKQVIKAIKRLRKAYQKRKIDKPTDLLATISRYSLSSPQGIIDEYINLGAEQIALRPLNKMGIAKEQWPDIGYSPEEFIDFWTKGMDYIIKLNKKGVKIKERIAAVLLRKILKKENPGYVDMSAPCGSGRSVLVYMPNGDAYPCDEARMTGSDTFKLGNILKSSYEDLMKSSNLFCICEASLPELWDYNCAYLPWMGTCPVLNYASEGNLVPKITATPLHKIYHAQLDYIFRKIIEDKANEKIFWNWANGG